MTGVLLDVETTGLDQRKDEVIELGMIKFDYLPDGHIAGLRDVFSSFNEPSDPIPPEVTALTGITNDMAAGHRIDDAAVSSFADDAVIIIAHNASSTENSRSATGRYFSGRLGDARRPKSSGGSTASKVRA
jgi:DNA polymerase III subunit epsilon